MLLQRTILHSVVSLLFLSNILGGNALAATNQQPLTSTKPGISTHNPQLRGKVTQDNLLDSTKTKLDLKSQQPKTDAYAPASQLTGKIKKHAVWDVYEHTLGKTDYLGRVPQFSLEIQTVFRTLKNDKVDDGTKRFLSFLVKNWGTFTSNEDPPPISLRVLGANMWAVSEQLLPIGQREHKSQMPNQQADIPVDTNNDDVLTKEELVNAIQALDAVPTNLRLKEGTYTYFRVRATLQLMLENFDMFDAETNKAEYRYL